MDVQRAAEAALLEHLRARRPELTALLDECSGHLGFEDPVYRFYHQSFEVYCLQHATTRTSPRSKRMRRVAP